VSGADVRFESLLTGEGPFRLAVTIDRPRFDVTWQMNEGVPTDHRDRDDLAAFATDVLRRQAAIGPPSPSV
jgi:hypothetical protein